MSFLDELRSGLEELAGTADALGAARDSLRRLEDDVGTYERLDGGQNLVDTQGGERREDSQPMAPGEPPGEAVPDGTERPTILGFDQTTALGLGIGAGAVIFVGVLWATR